MKEDERIFRFRKRASRHQMIASHCASDCLNGQAKSARVSRINEMAYATRGSRTRELSFSLPSKS